MSINSAHAPVSTRLETRANGSGKDMKQNVLSLLSANLISDQPPDYSYKNR